MPKIYHRPTPGSLIQFYFNANRGWNVPKVVEPVALVLSVRRSKYSPGKYNVDVLVDGVKREIFCWLGSDGGSGRRCVGHCDGNGDDSWWLSDRHVRWDVVS